MSFAILIAAARPWVEPLPPGTRPSHEDAALAWAAIERLHKMTPKRERKGSLKDFARKIVEIEEDPGAIDELRLLTLVTSGERVSDQIRRVFQAMDELTPAQKARLDALQEANLAALADFFADIGLSDVFDPLPSQPATGGPGAENSTTTTTNATTATTTTATTAAGPVAAAPEPLPPVAVPVLTDVKGIGPATAARLEGLGVTDIKALAALDDAGISMIEASVPRVGAADVEGWRAQAKALLSGE